MRSGRQALKLRGERLKIAARAKGRGVPATAHVPDALPVGTPPQRVMGKLSRVMLNSGEAVPIRYAVVEASSLITSHRGLGYERDPRFPAEAQPRDYGAEYELQFAVEQRAMILDPLRLLTDSVLPVDGPPVVRRDGVVISGNGRTQSMRLALARGLYGEVHEGILERASMYKLDAEAIASFREPVLVRLMESDVTDSYDLARYGMEMNRDPAQGMSSSEQAIGLARLMTQSVVDRLAELVSKLPDGYTVREFMRQRPKEIAATLSAAGLVDPRKRAAYFTAEGTLTEAGKELVETALAGATVTDINVFRDASLSTRDRLVRVGVQFMRMRSGGPKWDLAAYNNEAVRLVGQTESRAPYLRTLKSWNSGSGSLVDRLLYPKRFANATADLGLYAPPKAHPAVEALALALEESPSTYVRIIAEYAAKARGTGFTMFDCTHPADVFSATIGTRRDAGGRVLWRITVSPGEWTPCDGPDVPPAA